MPSLLSRLLGRLSGRAPLLSAGLLIAGASVTPAQATAPPGSLTGCSFGGDGKYGTPCSKDLVLRAGDKSVTVGNFTLPNFSIISVVSQIIPGYFEFTWSDQAPNVDPLDPNNPKGFAGDPFKATLKFNDYNYSVSLSPDGEDFIAITVDPTVQFPYVVEVKNPSLELGTIQLLLTGTAQFLTKSIAPNGAIPAITLTQPNQMVSLPGGVINALVTDSFSLDIGVTVIENQVSFNSSAATVDNIITQRFSAAPGPLPALGALSAFGWSRRMRRRLRSVRQV